MSEYSNPLLCHNEAGYYLTTLQVAIQFISNLKPEMLQIRVKTLCVRYREFLEHVTVYIYIYNWNIWQRKILTNKLNSPIGRMAW